VDTPNGVCIKRLVRLPPDSLNRRSLSPALLDAWLVLLACYLTLYANGNRTARLSLFLHPTTDDYKLSGKLN